jgi:hypothetical protein
VAKTADDETIAGEWTFAVPVTMAGATIDGAVSITADETAAETINITGPITLTAPSGSDLALAGNMSLTAQAGESIDLVGEINTQGPVTFNQRFTVEAASPGMRMVGTDSDDHYFLLAADKSFFRVTTDYNNGSQVSSPPIPLQLDNNTMEMWVYGEKVWTDGNDGSGSGLDADTLDGAHLSDILDLNTGFVTCALGPSNTTLVLPKFQSVAVRINAGKGVAGRYEQTGTSIGGINTLQIKQAGWYRIYFQLHNELAATKGMSPNRFVNLKAGGAIISSAPIISAVDAAAPCSGECIVYIGANTDISLTNGGDQDMQFWTGSPKAVVNIQYLGS